MKLTNGQCYIAINENGGVKKVQDKNEAYEFASQEEIETLRNKAKGKTKGYYVADEQANNPVPVKKVKKIQRKQYSRDVRKLIYSHADGRCALCGNPIAFEEMTLDHIVPLAMGGADEVENLQCSCKACNQFKGSILPTDFFDRIQEIFLYQIKNEHPVVWKICNRFISKNGSKKRPGSI